MRVGLLLDTNYFLHFRSFEEVDWRELGIASDVELIVCAVVLRELDRKKSDERPRMQKRARVAVTTLLELAEAHESRTQAGIPVTFVGAEPLKALANPSLDRSLGDDLLIANALEVAQSGAYERVVVISGDAGVVVKCRTFGIAYWRPTDDLRLSEPLDDSAREIRRLQEENHRLRSAQPRLVLRLAGSESSRLLGACESLADDVTPLSAEANEARYPPLQPGWPLGVGVDEEDRIEYNDALRSYHQQYRYYLHQYQSYRDWCARALELEFEVANEGRAPAEDLDIQVEFAAGVEIFKASARPPSPTAPALPKRPRSLMEKALFPSDMFASIPADWSASLQGITHFDRLVAETANVRGPWIEIGEQSLVSWNIRRLKHGEALILPAVLIVVPTAASEGCSVRYRLHAGNLPDPIESQLGFRITAQE